MSKKAYEEALVELEKFIDERKQIVKSAEECIDKYIVDRTLPFDYKDKCVEWQQELLDTLEAQILEANELNVLLKEKKELEED
ncbi:MULTISPECIES: hypothetical protein [unclassified Clostridioides]|uniref:hypothetical protein n=1 Tax=unclassified Clostridioides TaxID=2635829 RepID=UPI001D130117|nr:hypothetical protein [Clostridioides sp. ZZV15-6388]MCC0644030.1 hypothetical protein [Clostridioides sp. ZZV14-6150]MCC0659734.1 hypothetical protein [Clostridioides sp. ZZV14-6154]MCC0665926.1 hypothetical protein [Clostridioides sp. ZZV15-6597]MCC0666751.1 hypothetical protein [Clostridioides sp. ZZV14-6153]MCC0717773.1 hypothetical protein [Clostridioides sp. ZZV14-6105]MCC0722872.1 hypothetical protein [Clostridioides sp. ZZV14-6104]MCC0728183.1 hypothetical protein [Clostridioides s